MAFLFLHTCILPKVTLSCSCPDAVPQIDVGLAQGRHLHPWTYVHAMAATAAHWLCEKVGSCLFCGRVDGLLYSRLLQVCAYMTATTAVQVLGFIGSKMVGDFFGYKISTELSLGVVATLLGGGVAASFLLPEPDKKKS